MKNKFYLTTPIYYVNDKPHLGHAYTSIAADVLARYYRRKGREVFFLTGTDEHGDKVVRAAERSGQSAKEFTDRAVKDFERLTPLLALTNDGFIRTTNPKHEKIVREFLQELFDKGHFYKKFYEGLYCVGCEEFKTEKDLVDGKCPAHNCVPELRKEENWFFKLSAFESRIKKLIESDELKIEPVSRKNEILGRLREGLEDISISRKNIDWGIRLPWDEGQTVYVWVDALLNYYSAVRIFDGKGLWPPDLHLMAREIMWFHAVVWPALLLAAGEDLPKRIFVHGYFTLNGKKMSKTLGNVVDPNVLVKKYGTDAVRYYLLRDFPFGEDGDVSLERLKERYHSDLAGGLGNLVQRVFSMVRKYQITTQEIKPGGLNEKITKEIEDDIECLSSQSALAKIWQLIDALNKDIAKTEPWVLEREGKKTELEGFLTNCFRQILALAELVEPFLPQTADEIKKQANSLDLNPIFSKID